ncbi:MAG: NTP transferase domain-containing protein, partial [Elusimicrobia bacterium]|nr:NTP transferase domain-containing protein [Elusimicrobiota bacterium]
MKRLNTLILAAGEGTRMKSALPKVLHEAAGKSLLKHVLSAAAPLKGQTGVVLGRGADQVKEHLSPLPGIRFFLQEKRLGSGHAVMMAEPWLRRQGGDVVVLCGDAPMIRTETLKRLAGVHAKEGNSATVLTARVPRPFGYGRIVRGPDGRPAAIVEEKDATPEQRSIDEINSGMYAFKTPELLKALKHVRPNNA